MSINKFIITSILFLGSNVLGKFNIDPKTFEVVMIVLAFIPIIKYSKSWKSNKGLLYLVAFVLIYSSYRLFSDRGAGTRQMV